MSALYVHIPFCQHICTYCDFCKVFYNENWAWQYLDALAFEIQQKQLSHDYKTIYIGGGTPTALTYEQLQYLFELLKPYAHHCQEWSMEINPETMNHEKLELCVQNGVNRLSIGVQTFHNHLLKKIGRVHTCEQVKSFILEAQNKGVQDINIDLMYGLPEQTIQDVCEDIDELVKLKVGHVSYYSLILEDHTILKNEHYQPLNDEEDAKIYALIRERLQQHGYHQYEVSNFYAYKPSLHNLVYWHYEDYDGIGVSAHSLKNGHRYENTKSLTRYLEHHYLENDIILTESDRLFEKIMMGLRLNEGISISHINQLYGIDFQKRYHHVIEKYQKMNLLEIENGYLKTTSLGINYLNSILIDFLDDEQT